MNLIYAVVAPMLDRLDDEVVGAVDLADFLEGKDTIAIRADAASEPLKAVKALE